MKQPWQSYEWQLEPIFLYNFSALKQYIVRFLQLQQFKTFRFDHMTKQLCNQSKFQMDSFSSFEFPTQSENLLVSFVKWY